MTNDLGRSLEEAELLLDEAACITHQEARDLINLNAGTIGLHWCWSLLLMAATATIGASLIFSAPPLTMGDYLAFVVLLIFGMLCLSMLVIIHLKPLSFDGNGIRLGWIFAKKARYDWEQVAGLDSLPRFPALALLRFKDNKCWPVFLDLDHAQRLRGALSIWESAR